MTLQKIDFSSKDSDLEMEKPYPEIDEPDMEIDEPDLEMDNPYLEIDEPDIEVDDDFSFEKSEFEIDENSKSQDLEIEKSSLKLEDDGIEFKPVEDEPDSLDIEKTEPDKEDSILSPEQNKAEEKPLITTPTDEFLEKETIETDDAREKERKPIVKPKPVIAPRPAYRQRKKKSLFSAPVLVILLISKKAFKSVLSGTVNC